VRTATAFRGVYRCGFAGSQRAATVDVDHIKRHYYLSHPHLNPSRIVRGGPVLDFLH
jgi:glutathionyl-hydroquinone reductase